jgi:hypothetical protein
MFGSRKRIISTSLLLISLSACGNQATQDPSILTAVAQTVAAQTNLQPVTETPTVQANPIVTKTPLQFLPTSTPIPSAFTPTRPAGNTQSSSCTSASLVSETIPDGQIFRPGEQFWKTWKIQNTSPCTWTTAYKIIWWDGDVLGGAYIYNLPQVVPSGSIVPITLLFTAPSGNGNYVSEWKLETPDGTDFGVGEYNAAFYAEIVVTDAKKPNYTITEVEYQLVRVPATGCQANQTYYVYATVTANGPFEFYYYWTQKDGNDTDPVKAEFKEAGSKIFETYWTMALANTPGEKWIEFNVSEPFEKSYGRVTWNFDCGAY